MNCLALLIILFFFAGFAPILMALKFGLSVVLGFVNKVGATAVWLWESFLNYFRRERKEVINPFTGLSNFEEASQSDELSYSPTETPEKIYAPTDGEYIDYTEV